MCAQNRHTQNILRVLVVAGVGMIMGDGVLTPAISVVSACEGLQQASANITRCETSFCLHCCHCLSCIEAFQAACGAELVTAEV